MVTSATAATTYFTDRAGDGHRVRGLLDGPEVEALRRRPGVDLHGDLVGRVRVELDVHRARLEVDHDEARVGRRDAHRLVARAGRRVDARQVDGRPPGLGARTGADVAVDDVADPGDRRDRAEGHGVRRHVDRLDRDGGRVVELRLGDDEAGVEGTRARSRRAEASCNDSRTSPSPRGPCGRRAVIGQPGRPPDRTSGHQPGGVAEAWRPPPDRSGPRRRSGHERSGASERIALASCGSPRLRTIRAVPRG